MINYNAPIIPGQEAGGIRLGSNVEETLKGVSGLFEIERHNVPGAGESRSLRYSSANIDLWVKDNIIWQIMLHGDYQGKVLDKVGIGSTLADVRKYLGDIKVDMDNIIVKGLPGVAFEPEKDDESSPIIEIYVYEPDWVELMNSKAE
jgi:hypothetical protein